MLVTQEEPLTWETLKHTFKMSGNGDAWGTVMLWLFAVADRLEHEYDGAPSEWEFNPSPFGPDTESFEYQELEGASKELLERFGAALWKYRELLKLQGKNY